MTDRINDKNFIKLLIKTSVPIVFQQLLQNSLSFADTLMIGRLGQSEIAAVGLADQFYFLVSVVLFGISSGTSIFIGQFWGSREIQAIQKTTGIAAVIGIFFSAFAAVASIFFPHSILNLFISDESVVETGCIYLETVGISYIFVAVSQILSCTLRCTGNTVSPMKATLVSTICNITGNYFLIFRAGLGVFGAAIATAVSRFIELVILIYVVYDRSTIKIPVSCLMSFDRKFASKLLKTSFPVILDDGLWALGITVYKAVFSHMGVKTLAASNICESIQNLCFITQNAIGAGIAILISNMIGEGKSKKEVCNYGILSLKCAFSAGVLSLTVMALCSFFIPSFFNVDSTVQEIIRKSLIVLAFTLPVKFLNHANVCGVLRSGGDTKFVLFVEIMTIWLLGVPASFVSGILFSLNLELVYAAIFIEDLSKLLILIPRLKSGKWINNFSQSAASGIKKAPEL